MKLVGGDSGHYEREEFVEAVCSLRPSASSSMSSSTGPVSSRWSIGPRREYPLATIMVADEQAEPSLAAGSKPSVERGHGRRAGTDRAHLSASRTRRSRSMAEMDMGEPDIPAGATVAYTCPMHPDVLSDEPGKCPKCGMKLLATEAAPIAYACPMHPEVTSDQPDRCPQCGMKLVPAQLVTAALSTACPWRGSRARARLRRARG